MLVPPKVSYPGVYVVEVPAPPGGVPDIPTSLTAFVGRTRMGPTDEPILINSFGDFEAQFGGLWAHSPLSYSVKQYFDNGGSQAYIVRICATKTEIDALGEAVGYDPAYGKLDAQIGEDEEKLEAPRPYVDFLGLPRVVPPPDPQTEAAPNDDGCARINVGPDASAQALDAADPAVPPDKGFQLSVANPGEWGNNVRVELDTNGITPSIEAALKVAPGSMVNLTVHCDGGSERHAKVSFDRNAGPQRIDRMLETSRYVRYGADSKSIDQADSLIQGSDPTRTPLADIVELHQVTYRNAAKTQDDYLAQLPGGQGGDDGYLLQDAGLFSGDQNNQKGIYQLDKIDIFNLLVIPRDTLGGADLPLDYPTIFNYVSDRRAFWILEVPPSKLPDWDGKILRGQPGVESLINDDFANPGELGRNAAVFYPDVFFPDPLLGLRATQYGPAGAVAGIFARTDASRGVWKAPAGTEATVTGLVGLTAKLNDAENGVANVQGINCFREFPPTGTVLWGSRTLRGAQALADAFKYIPVRRLSLYVYESIRRGLQWAVFEPNDESLWATIRDRVDDFMTNLMRQGAFQGSTKKEAFYVRCGLGDTMTAQDVDNGICNVQIGFAPVKPAEFVVLYFEQMTADSQG